MIPSPDSAGQVGGAPVEVREVWPIRYEASRFDVLPLACIAASVAAVQFDPSNSWAMRRTELSPNDSFAQDRAKVAKLNKHCRRASISSTVVKRRYISQR